MGCYFSILHKIPTTSSLNFKSDHSSKWQFGEWSVSAIQVSNSFVLKSLKLTRMN